MSIEQNIENLEIRNANVVTFVGSSSTIVDTISGRIQCKGFQHNSNVITDISGPHGRVVPTLKKYPEIVFDASKMDGNDSTNTYTQAGYTVTASSQVSDVKNASTLYDGRFPAPGNTRGWQGSDGTYDSLGDATSIDTLTGITGATSSRNGSYTTLELPHKIKVSRIQLHTRNSIDHSTPGHPGQVYIYGSNDGSSWTQIGSHLFTSVPASPIWQRIDINSTTPYNYFALQVTSILDNSTRTSLLDLEWYGTEEYTPAGDHSVDTTIMSRFNNPQLTGVQVLVDGATGQGTNQISGGPDPSGNQSTMTSPNKYWTLNGTLTSSLSVEANTFLEGDAPHSVSVWFNSSNLEANVSNTCVFSVSDQEKLDSVNLDLQSNTWHNLTYAYQGEGGSRVTYLDGRKVAEDQAEDTFGEYPPFAMTGYSQGGYVVSASSLRSGHEGWHAFDKTKYAGGAGEKWASEASQGDTFTGGDSLYNGTNRLSSSTQPGAWLKIELPYKLRLQYMSLFSDPTTEQPEDFIIYGSNDDNTWDQLFQKTGATANTDYVNYTINSVSCYKYFALVVRRLISSTTIAAIDEWKLYGHRENDLVRLPDPTNVLKYPHIAMSGPAQRGYVASAKNFVAGREPWEAFNGYVYGTHPSNPNDNGWMSNGLEFIKSTGAYYQNGDTFTDTASGTHTGPWIRLETPHKLQLSSFDISNGNNAERRMKSIVILGSDDASVSTGWSLIYTNTNITNAQDVNGLVVNSSQAFKYHMIVTKAVSGAPGQSGSTAVWVAELQLYGTGVDSVPIQIGGGNIDRVANFRVYDKFVGEDQALEIWDAQKDEFGRAKSSMTLQKGRLGIGTTEPQGRLAVADEPHNLEEFPPSPMTGYKNYFEGHGEFCVSASSYLDLNTYPGWKSFNHTGTSDNYDAWLSADSIYTLNTNVDVDPSVATNINGVYGEWLELKLPYKIILDRLAIKSRGALGNTYGYTSGPAAGNVWGSNDGLNWTLLSSFTGFTYKSLKTSGAIETLHVNSITPYSYFRLQPTKRVLQNPGYTPDSYVAIGELRYFGTREQGQSVLHDGQLTLTKNLNVPRIGPALDADDTPRRDRLVVEYNTSTNPTFEGAVRDTSGRGFHGALFGGAYYDANEKALRFDGSGDYTEVQLPSHQVKGEWIHSVSCWVKADIIDGEEAVWNIGDRTGQASSVVGSASTLAFNNTSPTLRWYLYDADAHTSNFTVATGQWYHITCVYTGGVSSATSQTIYVNGVEYAFNIFAGTGGALNFDANRDRILMLGRLPWGTASDLDGSISNFKLWDTALTAEEVKTLYDMGRCDEGHHVVNFSKTRVGIGLGDGEVPRVALDVRGDIVSSGIIGPQARASATTFYNLGYRGTGFYPIRGRAPTSGGLGPEGDIYRMYCNMDPNWYGGKWMCFARINRNDDFNGVNIFSRTVVGDPSDLGSSFTVPIGIMAPDNIGYDLEVMVTVHGGNGSGSVGPWRSDFGGRVGGIWTGISLNNAFDETRGDNGYGPSTSNPRVSDDGINYTSITGTFVASVGWAFTISKSGTGTGSYNDSNKGTSGWILHENSNNGHTYAIYARVFSPNDGGSSGGELLSNYTDWDYVHVWIRAPE